MSRPLGSALGKLRGGGHPVWLEYPPPAPDAPRWGWGRPANPALVELLAGGITRYRAVLDQVEAYRADLRAIPWDPGPAGEPHWSQHWFTGIDAAVLYSEIRERRPARYVEIGSGNSTLFAARAVRDGRLSCRITSVDPEPRAEVDAVCDEVVRLPFERTDGSLARSLRRGDVLLVDSSHHALPGSDVVAFFLDVLPALAPGVLVGIHDVFLPDDYPWWMEGRWYSEQYLLAAWLLGRANGDQVVFPAHFAATSQAFRPELETRWEAAGLAAVRPYGSALWLETA